MSNFELDYTQFVVTCFPSSVDLRVHSTVSSGFNESLFFQLPVTNEAPDQIWEMLEGPSTSLSPNRLAEDTDFKTRRSGKINGSIH